MENINPISNPAPLSPTPKTTNKKWIFVIVAIIVLGVLGFLAWQYVKKNHLFGQPYTLEEKMEILNNLRTEPPADGSVDMTTEEKLDLLERLSNKKEITPVPSKTQN